MYNDLCEAQEKLMSRVYSGGEVGTMYNDLCEAQEKLNDVYTSVKEVASLCSRDEPEWQYVQIILSRCPATELDISERFDRREAPPITQKSLATLHARLKQSQLVARRYECLYADLLKKAIHLEDVVDQASKPDRQFISTIRPPPSGFFAAYLPSIMWWWLVKIRPFLYLSLAIVASAFSLAVLWSEITFSMSNPTISIYAILINSMGHTGHYFNLELVTFLTLFYLSLCTYRVIFRLRIFNFYNLVPKQQTDAARSPILCLPYAFLDPSCHPGCFVTIIFKISYNLIFSAILLSRLIIPLCLNFLSMTHLDNHVTASTIEQPTAFTQVMGHIDVFRFIKDFNTYYPITILLVSSATLFRLGSRILSLCGVPSLVVDDETTQDAVSEGKMLIRRERRALQRGETLGRQSVNVLAVAQARLDGTNWNRGNASDSDTGSSSRGSRGKFNLINGFKNFVRFGRSDRSRNHADSDREELLPTTNDIELDDGSTRRSQQPRDVFDSL
eukprot:gene206-3591_t